MLLLMELQQKKENWTQSYLLGGIKLERDYLPPGEEKTGILQSCPVPVQDERLDMEPLCGRCKAGKISTFPIP